MALVLLLLALGSHTPLFRLLYDCVPGFNRFRGMSKFAVQASAFIVLLSGIGLDRLIRAAKVDRRLAAAPVLLGAALLIAAAWIGAPADPNVPSPGWWRMMRGVGSSHPRRHPSRPTCTTTPPSPARRRSTRRARCCSRRSRARLRRSALLYLRSARKLALRPRHRGRRRDAPLRTVHPADVRPGRKPAAGPEAVRRLPSRRRPSAHPGQPGRRHVVPRVWLLGICAAPARQVRGVHLRIPGKEAGQRHVVFAVSVLLLPIYKMLRFRYVIQRSGDPAPKADEFPGSMPRVALITQYQVVSGREAIFDAMLRPSVRSGAEGDSRIAAGPRAGAFRRAGAGESDANPAPTSWSSRPTWPGRRSCSSPTTTTRPGARAGCRAAASRGTR